jgi:hypothetical protein
METLLAGDKVEVVDRFNGSTRVVCKGVVERVTPTQYVVRNEHNNIGRYRRADMKMVGYAWPQLTHELRKAVEPKA